MGLKQQRINRVEWVEPKRDEPRWYVEIQEFRDGRWQFSVDSLSPRFPLEMESFGRDQEAELREELARAGF